MADAPTELTGPDFAAGIPLATLDIGAMQQGHAHGAPVLLVRRADSIVAIGAFCSHYGGALADGVLDGDTVRCPLHHACFDLDTGEAIHAPAFEPLPRWTVDVRDKTIFVTSSLAPAAINAVRDATDNATPHAAHDSRMVIVGGGAAGDAAAEMLRRQGYEGAITMLSADANPPGDRPNFSKGTLSGTVPMEFNFVRAPGFYTEHRIDLRVNTVVSSIDTNARAVQLASGESITYDALLLATGAEPVRLTVPGATLPHVCTLRTLADSLNIAERASQAKRVVIIGASFIGLEVAAALRARGIDVHVVAREDGLMANILGADVGAFIQSLHERHGVTFHLRTTVSKIETDHVVLENGETLSADLVVAGIGVRPMLTLATQAGLRVDNGVLVNAQLESSAPGVYAAGDIARWTNHAGTQTRVEHWVVAQRQGQVAARNMLGANETFDAVPFFWTEQYDMTLRYVGHAERGFTTEVIGSFDGPTPAVRINYFNDGRLAAVATIGRDEESLHAELLMERARVN